MKKGASGFRRRNVINPLRRWWNVVWCRFLVKFVGNAATVIVTFLCRDVIISHRRCWQSIWRRLRDPLKQVEWHTIIPIARVPRLSDIIWGDHLGVVCSRLVSKWHAHGHLQTHSRRTFDSTGDRFPRVMSKLSKIPASKSLPATDVNYQFLSPVLNRYENQTSRMYCMYMMLFLYRVYILEHWVSYLVLLILYHVQNTASEDTKP